MQTITIEIPDVIWESHQQDMGIFKEEIERGLVIWEYLNGRLSIGECGDILKIGYRGFLELLWDRGIDVDALRDDELDDQLDQLRKLTTS